MNRINRPFGMTLTAAAMGALALCLSSGAWAAEDAERVDFARDIQPIFQANCYQCHTDKLKGGLRLDLRAAAMRGGDLGVVIQPGDSAASRLLQRVTAANPDDRMPPNGAPLADDQVAKLRAWIDQGADWPDELAGQEKVHWAYVAPNRPTPPTFEAVPPKYADWVRNPIDAFVLRKLLDQGLTPSPQADRATLLRRVSFDLTGLPPTLEQVQAFEADTSPDAYEAAVDRLLASPAFGERWARMWLDLARYADTQGYEKDRQRHIWRYRDWVIQAFNRNMPFDQFTIEQIAGDLLPKPTTDQLIATAFHRNTMTNTEGGTDDEEFRTAAVVDRVNTTWSVWMGATFACAQCHTHKYDPFTQKEYYEFLAFLNNTEDRDRADEYPTIETLSPEQAALKQTLAKQIASLEQDLKAAAEAEQQAVRDRLVETKKQLARIKAPRTPIMRELTGDKRRPTHVMIRGSFLDKGPRVEPGVPRVMHPLPPTDDAPRLAAAKWLVDPANPLTARVTVNRFWAQLFGVGIVETVEDFGTQGAPPSHPQLLDWLALEFMQPTLAIAAGAPAANNDQAPPQAWEVKRILKMMVMSSTYQQSSAATPQLIDRDPDNRLLARGPRFRLSAEMIRDQALAVSGLLSDKMYGPSVMPPQPDAVWNVVYSNERWVTSQGEDRYRRGLYTFLRRTSPYPSSLAFDAGSGEFCLLRRIRTNTPLAALVTMNDPVHIEAAQALARRVLREAGPNAPLADQVTLAFRLCVSRAPTPDEVARLVDAAKQLQAHFASSPDDATQLATNPLGPLPQGLPPQQAAAWTAMANILLNLDETLTKN